MVPRVESHDLAKDGWYVSLAPSENDGTVCECCEGRGQVPTEGQSGEHGMEPCPFCVSGNDGTSDGD